LTSRKKSRKCSPNNGQSGTDSPDTDLYDKHQSDLGTGRTAGSPLVHLAGRWRCQDPAQPRKDGRSPGKLERSTSAGGPIPDSQRRREAPPEHPGPLPCRMLPQLPVLPGTGYRPGSGDISGQDLHGEQDPDHTEKGI